MVTPLAPRLDAETAPWFRDQVGALAEGRRVVVVDLAHVQAVDPSGLAALVYVLKRMAPGGDLRLLRAAPRIRALLTLTRLDEVFPAYEDASAALPA